MKLFNPKTKIEFHNTTFDFGDIPAEKDAVTYFVYTNTGNSPLKIANISSSCGCTVPKWSREKLQPGQKDSIMVIYDAETYGYYSKVIYVFSNAESSHDALYIEGTVVEGSKILIQECYYTLINSSFIFNFTRST